MLCIFEDIWWSCASHRFLEPHETSHRFRKASVVMDQVSPRPFYRTFLRRLTSIANVSVWSSLKRSMAEFICEDFFKGLPFPVIICGKEECELIKYKTRGGKIKHCRSKKTKEVVYLKPLEKLCQLDPSVFTPENTIMVDCGPARHIYNEPSNVILLEKWSYLDWVAQDSILIDNLLPYIQRLHNERPSSLFDFRWDNLLGLPHLMEENSSECWKLEVAVELSIDTFGRWKDIDPWNVVSCRKPHKHSLGEDDPYPIPISISEFK